MKYVVPYLCRLYTYIANYDISSPPQNYPTINRQHSNKFFCDFFFFIAISPYFFCILCDLFCQYLLKGLVYLKNESEDDDIDQIDPKIQKLLG